MSTLSTLTSLAPPTKREQFPDFFRVAGNLESGVIDLAKGEDYDAKRPFGVEPITHTDLSDANVITSRFKPFGRATQDPPNPEHKIAIDLDMDAVLVPTSTPGHHHLIIEKILPWSEYLFLLKALLSVGLIQQGYYDASVNRGATVLRTPWTKK